MFYSLFVGVFIYRELKFDDILRVLVIGIENLGLVMLLMSSGKVFAWVLGMEKIAERATEMLFSITSSPAVIILLINLLLLFMGTFMETNASILILTPILMPIVQQIGMHPIQFGVIMIFALMIGLLTPPMAICLFITSKLGRDLVPAGFQSGHAILCGAAGRSCADQYFPTDNSHSTETLVGQFVLGGSLWNRFKRNPQLTLRWKS